jgi:hypothetical protein
MDDECGGEDGRDQCEKEQPEEPEETKKQTAVSRWSAEASCELLSAMALLTAEIIGKGSYLRILVFLSLH